MTSPDLPGRRWLIRHGCGCVRELSSLTHLAKLIDEDRLDIRVEISAGDGHWRRLDDVVDRQAFSSTFKALGYIPRGTRCADLLQSEWDG